MPSIVQSKSQNSGTSLSTASGSLAFASNLASGNIIVVAWTQEEPRSAPTPAITDTQSNTFTLRVSRIQTDMGGYVWLYTATAQSGADTITAGTSNSSGNSWGFSIYELNGVAEAPSQSGSATGTGGPGFNAVSPAINFNANDILIGACATETAGSQPNLAPGANFTLLGSWIGIPASSNGANEHRQPGAGGSSSFPFGADINTNPNFAGAGAVWAPAAGGVVVFIESGPKRQYRREGFRR